MIRSLAGALFSAEVTNAKGESVRAVYTQSDATELGFKEDWLQNSGLPLSCFTMGTAS